MKNLNRNIITAGLFFTMIFCAAVNTHAKIIDSLSTLWTINTNNETDNKVSVESNSNKIEYDFNTVDWMLIEKTNFFDQADSIAFYYKGTGSANSLNVQIYDSDDNVNARKLYKLSNRSSWTRVIIPITSMSPWAGVGDGSFDTAKIEKIEFAVGSEVGGSGTLAIDKMQTYDLNTAESLTVASFDFGIKPHDLGGGDGSGSDGTDPTVTYSEQSYSGPGSMKISYNIDATWAGYWVFTSTNDASGFLDIGSYTHLKFWVKSDVAGKDFRIKIEDRVPFPRPQVKLKDYYTSGTSTVWNEVSIPLTDFAPPIKSTSAKNVQFIFEAALPPVSGTVYIDDIRFTTASDYTGGTVTVVDDMDVYYSQSGWSPMGRDESTGITSTSLSSVTGYEDEALELSYSFNRGTVDAGDWAVMYRNWGMNLAAFSGIKFDYKGTGAANNIEFKIDDGNKVVFWRKIFGVTNTNGEWKTVTVPFKDFDLFEAGDEDDETIELNSITGLYFALSKSEGSTGTVYIKNLDGIYEGDYETTRQGKLISSLSVANNPFTPDGDGIAERAEFSFVLSQNANVEFQVFDLAGSKVCGSKSQGLSSGITHTIYWDGKDDSGSTVKNGLYFYKLSADSGTSDDSITHVIGVYR